MAAEPEIRDLEELENSARVEEVLLADLDIDRSYQKDPSQQHVDRIAEDYDAISSELILVSDRGKRDPELGVKGGLFIVNGQHRTLAARKNGRTTIWARIIDTSGYADPAALEARFRLRTNVRNPDKSAERFKAQLRAGDPESVAIMAIIADYDTEINFVPNAETGINAVTSLERLYRVDGSGDLLRATLQLLKDAFGYVGGKAAASNLMLGVAWFIMKHGEEVSRERVVDKLGSIGLAALDRRARGIAASQAGPLWSHTYRAIVDFYNERLHDATKLEWRLRGVSRFGATYGRRST